MTAAVIAPDDAQWGAARIAYALMLHHELNGDRRGWGEKTLANFTECLDQLAGQFRLKPDSGVLPATSDEHEVYPLAAVRLWTQQFGVQIGWSLFGDGTVVPSRVTC